MEIGVEIKDSYQEQHDLTDELIKSRSTTAFIRIICAFSTSKNLAKEEVKDIKLTLHAKSFYDLFDSIDQLWIIMSSQREIWKKN